MTEKIDNIMNNLNITSEDNQVDQPSNKVDEPTKVLTILLLGETGVGKTTFINALANYLLHDELEAAIKQIYCLIPLQFVHTSQDFKEKLVSLGESDSNESNEIGESSTQSARCYVFLLGDYKINIIDTPGIGDTRGVDKDFINMRNLLNFISNYKEINAICVLLKPNQAKANVLFKYCILELLTHLNKSASENIVFVYTNSRGTLYRPGDTGPTLRTLLNKIKENPPNVEIKYDMDNTFCFDNESFRFLVADANGVQFDDEAKDEFRKSWNRSQIECRRMMCYINSLTPHQVQETISINNARKTILNLTKPLGDTAKTIADNIKDCERRKKIIFEFEGNVNELKKELYIPTIELKSEKLYQPVTVCGDSQCCDTINVNGTSKTHYKTICHNPCYLQSSDGNVIGNTGLLDCQAFNKYKPTGNAKWVKESDCNLHPDQIVLPCYRRNGEIFIGTSERTKSDVCFKCHHSYQSHLHIFTKTTVINKKIRDETKFKLITNREEAMKAQQQQIDELEKRVKQLESEQKIITECTGKFAHFLKNNAMSAINDAFEEYLKHLINNERSCWNDDSDRTVESLTKMLKNHQIEKEILQGAMNEGSQQTEQITNEDVDNLLNKLFKLEISGPIIKGYLEAEEKSHQSAHSAFNEIKFDAIIESKMSTGLINKIKKLFGLA